MKKRAFYVVSIIAALLSLFLMAGCGGGGGGSSGSSGVGGSPSGTSTYTASAAFPYGFFGTSGTGTLWIFNMNSNSALYFRDATHAFQVTRVGSSNSWERGQNDVNFDVEITSGSEGYVKFSNTDSITSAYSYNITDTTLVISNTLHGSKSYTKYTGTFTIQ